MAWKAKFRTAYDQREIPLEAIVSTGNSVAVGSLVEVVQDGTNPAIIKPVTANTAAAALAIATHIVAQSDMTMEYGHVPVEYRDYRYSDEVAPSIEGQAINSEFQGFFDSVEALTAGVASPTAGDSALVKVKPGTYHQYLYSSNKWGLGSETVVATTKKVALFKIIEEDDVIVYDA